MEEGIRKISLLSIDKFKKNVNKLDIEKLRLFKEYCDDIYYNSEKTILSDEQYDILKEILIKKDQKYIEKVGSKIRDDDNRVELPFWLGSIDKIKNDNPSSLERWLNKNKFDKYILENKLDGISCLLISKNNEIFLYTRGDGKIGADISYLCKYFKNIPKNIKENIAIRGELIIKKEIFEKKYKSSFANPRNMVSGIVGSKSFKDGLNDVDFIAYEIVDQILKPSEQLKKLEKLGFQTVYNRTYENIDIENLEEELIYSKNNSIYEIDGIIVQSDSEYERNTSGNPKYAFAFKMMIGENIVETEVEDVEWNTSKWGILKPRIKVKTVHLNGVNINYTTGFNAKFIYDNKIGKGSVIKITRSGDVIPYIVDVVKRSKEPSMPDNFKWNESKVDIIIDNTNISETDEMNIKMITSIFEKLNVKFVSEKTVEKIYNEGYKTFLDIIKMKKEDLLKIKGIEDKLATKIYENIRNGLSEMTVPLLIGASGVLGFGIGVKKINALFDSYPEILEDYNNIDKEIIIKNIVNVEGFSDKTANKIYENLENANKFLKDVNPYICWKIESIKEKEQNIEKSLLSDKKICFSGFRDKDLEKQITERDGKVTTSVSKNTYILIVKDIEDNSSKIKDAKKNNVEIIEKDKFIKKFII
jgi:NAD-dependent DNA ligase